jgi:hypothetical protein
MRGARAIFTRLATAHLSGGGRYRAITPLWNILEDLGHDPPLHLPWFVDSVNVQNRWRKIEDADRKSHEAQVLFDIGTGRNKHAGHVIPILKIVVSNDGRGSAMFVGGGNMPRMCLLEFPQWLDSVIGYHKHVGVCVHVFQDLTEHLIKRSVLVGKSLQPDSVDPGIVPNVVRLDDANRLAQNAGNEDRQLALEAAAMNGRVRALAVLIDLGVDVNAYNTKVQYHATPLHNAVSSGSLEAVKMLVEAGARVGTEDAAYQATPLTWAEYFLREEKNKKQYAEIVAYLREKQRAG